MYIAVGSQHTGVSLYFTISKLLYTYVRTYVCTHKHMHIICMCVYNKQNMYNRTTYVLVHRLRVDQRKVSWCTWYSTGHLLGVIAQN